MENVLHTRNGYRRSESDLHHYAYACGVYPENSSRVCGSLGLLFNILAHLYPLRAFLRHGDGPRCSIYLKKYRQRDCQTSTRCMDKVTVRDQFTSPACASKSAILFY